MDLPPGFAEAIADRYRVIRGLGTGGMASVYLAHDLRHDRDVAIKVLGAHLAAALGAERFLAEIRTTARLQHPHILPLFDSGEAAGRLFFVTPFVSGESLRDRLDREGRLPVDDAVRLAAEVADALGHAHQHDVVHRDIKPENILLLDGRAVVADFGIALEHRSATERLTETGVSLGTPAYMSPEQALGERAVDLRTDLYSLGCVLYEMLAGTPPFTGESAQAIVAQVITSPPPAVRRHRREVPIALEATVQRALAKDPGDRFATAAEMATAIRDGTGSGRGPRVATRPAAGVVVLLAIVALVVLVSRRGAGPTPVPAPIDHQPDTAAVRLTVEGHAWMERRTATGCDQAKVDFSEAIVRDSLHVPAYAGLAQTHALCALFGQDDPRLEYVAARTMAEKALALDSMAAPAYVARGMSHLFSEQDWSATDADLRRAIAIDSTLPAAYLFRTWYFVAQQQLDSAEAMVRLAKVRAPTSDVIGTRLGTILRLRGDWDGARRALDVVLARDSSSDLARPELLEYDLDRRACRPALSDARWIESHGLLRPGASNVRYTTALVRAADAMCGPGRQATAYLREAERAAAAGQYVDAFSVAIVAAAEGDADGAMRWLDRAVEGHNWALFFLPVYWAFTPYHEDARFRELLRRVHLAPTGAGAT